MNMLFAFNDLINYFKENMWLGIALIVIVALLLITIIALIVVSAKKRAAGRKARTEETTDENVVAEQPANDNAAEKAAAEKAAAEKAAAEKAAADKAAADKAAAEKVAAEKAAADKAAADKAAAQKANADKAVAKKKEEPVYAEVRPDEDTKPVAAQTPAEQTKPAKKPAAAKTAAAKNAKSPIAEKAAPKTYSGKWFVTEENGTFTFELRASNGEKLLGGGNYTSMTGAKKGIETYKNNIQNENFKIIQLKSGDFIYQLLNARGTLLSHSEAYKSKSSCESAVESTKRFAATASIEIAKPEEEN